MGGSVWNLGGARGPFTAKKRPLFDEHALKMEFKESSLLIQGGYGLQGFGALRKGPPFHGCREVQGR